MKEKNAQGLFLKNKKIAIFFISSKVKRKYSITFSERGSSLLEFMTRKDAYDEVQMTIKFSRRNFFKF